MNNPYGIEVAPLDLIAIAHWNHRINRSIDDYWLHPHSTAALGRSGGACVECEKPLPERRTLCGRCAAVGEPGRSHK